MAKQHPADMEADRLIQIQRGLSPATRRGDIALIVICALLILSFAIGIYCIPHRDFSETENDVLQTFPRLSSTGKFLDRLWDGRFMAELKDFYTDQFPFRDKLVAAKASMELLLGKGENNAVIAAKDSYLIKRIEYSESELDQLTQNLDAVTAFREGVDLPVTFALAPRAIDVLDSYFPAVYQNDRAESVWTLIDAYAAEQPLLSLRELLRTRAAAGESVWYRTDHHWTTRGAYYAYAELAALYGYTPTPIEQFTVEIASTEFLGTTYSASGFYGTESECIEFYRWDGDDACTLEILAGDEMISSFNGFYDRSYLEKKDKYAAFLSSNNAHMRIRDTQNPDKPTLLLIKDSFAHSVVPFLAQHYNLEILDLRYYRASTVSAFLEKNQVDGVLILCGLDSLATSNLLESLPVGME